MDPATLKKFKPTAYEDAADGYRATGGTAGKAEDAIDVRISSGMRAQLEGEAATAALKELKELKELSDFYPASPGQLDEAMERLKAELPKNGWKISEYGPDTSENRNLSLTADNDAEKTSVHVSQRARNDPPKLSLMLVSGCYEIPAGQEIERF